LTENTVRSQLTTMQRYGLVKQGIRRTLGAGKPAYEYHLTRQAQSMFPVAHGIMVDALLSGMEEELRPADFEQRLRTAGRRMAGRQAISWSHFLKPPSDDDGVALLIPEKRLFSLRLHKKLAV
jgi:predicted ArsR family transcriptional regulator